MKLRIVILFLILLGAAKAFGQLHLYNSLKNGAFIPRNSNTNAGEYVIKGSVNNTSFTSLDIIIYQSGAHFKTHRLSLNFIHGFANFTQKIELKAGKYFYKIEYKLTGSSTYSQTVDGIMVGDVYLIQGQSNSVAGNYGLPSSYNSAYNDTFIRSFGSSYPYFAIARSDTNWHKMNATGIYSPGCIGEWGAVMAKNLLDSFGIPICVINGGVGGTKITQHVPTPGNSADLNSIYGRLLYRVQKAQLQNNIKGIIYYQGESDGSNARLHDSLFRIIYGNWNKDYKGFKKLYVVQVRNGCGAPSMQLRDYQRQFEFTLGKCKTISANGMNNGDGCHFGFVNGYELLGKQIAALISKDIYGSSRKTNIDPPNIKNAYYSNANQTEITLNFQNPNDSFYLDNLFYKLFKIVGDNSVVITNGFKRNNKVVLQLNKSSCYITGLSYDGLPFAQPWVKNTIGMGLISFYNIPILKNQIKPFYQGCKNSMVTMGEDSVAGYLYQWKRLSNNKIYKTAKIKVLANSAEKFELVITYGNSACKNKDTLYVYLSPDPIAIPELGKDTTICFNDTLTLKPNNFGFTQFLWKSSNGTNNYFSYKTGTTEKIVLIATSQQQCTYKDSVNITISKPLIALPQNISICIDKDTLIQVSNTFDKYYWNNAIGINSYRAKVGKLSLLVSNHLGCIAKDSTIIKSFAPIEKLNITKSICSNESMKISKPNNIYKWYFHDSLITDSLIIRPPNYYDIQLQDSNNCFLFDTIKTISMPVPQFDLGKDTGFCIGKSYAINLPIGMDYYQLNIQQFTNNNFEINNSGTHIFKVVSKQQCVFIDTIKLKEYKLPEIEEFYDTILCNDTQWKIILPQNFKYKINGINITDSVIIKSAGVYEIECANENGCTTQKTIEIDIIKCQSSVLNTNKFATLQVYPNPFSELLTIKSTSNDKIPFILTDIFGKTILESYVNNSEVLLNLSALDSGIYFLITERQTFRLLKLP